MAEAIPQDGPGLLEVPRQPARQKRLTYADVQGYEQLLSSLVMLPGSHAQNMPKAPMLDAGQWVDTHFKQVCVVMLSGVFEVQLGFVRKAWVLDAGHY